MDLRIVTEPQHGASYGMLLRAARTTPWQMAPTGSRRENASTTVDCSVPLSR